MVPYRLAAFPSTSGATGNPYIDLFYSALEPYQIERIDLRIEDAWLRSNAQSIDAIHLHWAEYIWRWRGESTFAQARGVLGLWKFLRIARQLRLRVICTMHNLEPHEGFSWIDRWGYRVLARLCDLLIVHNEQGAEKLRREYKARGMVISIPHGSYVSVYPEPRPRETVLKAFGLSSELPLVCCMGILRDYKGLEIACKAVERLRGQVQMVIAGERYRDYDVQPLQEAARRVPGILLLDRFITNQEFSDLISASEAVLLPYLKVTGSGVLLAAWTLGCGTIASDLPFFREMLGDRAGGALFPCGDAIGLADAIIAYHRIPAGIRRQAALELAEHFSWENCIKPIARILREWADLKEGSCAEHRGRSLVSGLR
jgi:glycosyltransferase involved in cell wall biosynthesis